MTNRIKGIFRKHWKLITLLNKMFPVIAYRANPSLKKLVRAKLKPLNQTETTTRPDLNNTEQSNTTIIEPNYPFDLFQHTLQKPNKKMQHEMQGNGK